MPRREINTNNRFLDVVRFMLFNHGTKVVVWVIVVLGLRYPTILNMVYIIVILVALPFRQTKTGLHEFGLFLLIYAQLLVSYITV